MIYMQELWGQLCSVKNLRDVVFAIWYLDLFQIVLLILSLCNPYVSYLVCLKFEM
jgi:hypothetical protein